MSSSFRMRSDGENKYLSERKKMPDRSEHGGLSSEYQKTDLPFGEITLSCEEHTWGINFVPILELGQFEIQSVTK